MALAVTILDVQPSDRAKVIVAKGVFSGSYVQFNAGTNAGEGPINLNTATNSNDLPFASFGVRGFDRIYPLQGPAGYSAQFIQSNNGSWFVKIWSSSGTELSAGAYPAAITGDTAFQFAFEGKNY